MRSKYHQAMKEKISRDILILDLLINRERISQRIYRGR